MGKTKSKAPNPLRDAAKLMLKAVESAGKRRDLDISGDVAALARNVAISKWRDIDINTSRTLVSGCIAEGLEQLRQARSLLVSVDSQAADRIVDESLKAIGRAIDDLALLREPAESYDRTGDTTFFGFLNVAEFNCIFSPLNLNNYISIVNPSSRLHELVFAADRWLVKHGEDLRACSCGLTSAAEMLGASAPPKETTIDGTHWLTCKQSIERLNNAIGDIWAKPTFKKEITKRANTGELRSNGKTGPARRIAEDSVEALIYRKQEEDAKRQSAKEEKINDLEGLRALNRR